MIVKEIDERIAKHQADILELRQAKKRALKKDPSRRLKKYEIDEIKIMLQAGEEPQVIAKKSRTNVKVVRYWQESLKITDVVKPSTDDRLIDMKNRHTVGYKYYSLSESGKIEHDQRRRCPACFPESSLTIDEYNVEVRTRNFKTVVYAKKHSTVPNKSLISQDKIDVKKVISPQSSGIFDKDGKDIGTTVADRYRPPVIDLTPEYTKTTKIRKLEKRMNNVPTAVIVAFLKSKGIEKI